MTYNNEKSRVISSTHNVTRSVIGLFAVTTMIKHGTNNYDPSTVKC